MMHAASDTFAMFWRFGMPTTSHIDTLLEKEDITLSEVLEEDDVLQECKSQNRKLVDFLVRTDVMEELVSLITTEPSEDLHESIQYKNPNMACELLTSDVAAICDKLADTESAFTKLWQFLDRPAPLNPLLASFFSKTVGSLLSRRPEVVVEYIKGKEDCVGLLLSHLEVSAVMDLILRLVTCIESPEIRIAFLNWLNEQRFVQRLVDLIDTEQSEDTHSNAAQTLCDIVRLTREHMSQLQECAENDPLLTTLEMEETVSELLDHMFKGSISESAIVNGIAVLLSLLEFRKQGAAWTLSFGPDGQEQMTQLDAERLARGVSGTLKAVVSRLADMQQLLEDPPGRKALTTSVGKLEPPLGNVRLQISKLVSALLITNTAAINAELARLGTIKKILDLFLNYAWNNFLHLEVEKSISTILSNNPTETEDGKSQHPLLVHLFTESRLIPKVMEAWEENDKAQKQNRCRRGYMGHLTRIANAITQESEKGCNSDQIKSLFQEYIPDDVREKWSSFVNGSLADTNKRNHVELVGTHPLHSSSEDDDSDFKDIDFGKDTALQQFGFNDEEFAEQEESVNNPFDRISDINFSISANEDNPNSALFEACCNERVQPFNDSNSDEEDIWEEKELTYTANTDLRTSDLSPKNETGSDAANQESSSDEETDEAEDSRENTIEDFPSPDRPAEESLPAQPSEDTKMDVDSDNAWPANFDKVPVDTSVAMDTTPSGWGQPATSTEEGGDTGWANFNDFNAAFSADGSPGPRSSSPVDMDSEPSSQEDKKPAPAAAENSPSPLRGSAYVVSSSSQEKNKLSGEAEAAFSPSSNEASPGHSEEKPMIVEPMPSAEDVRLPEESTPSQPAGDPMGDNTVSSSSDSRQLPINAAPAADSGSSVSLNNASNDLNAQSPPAATASTDVAAAQECNATSRVTVNNTEGVANNISVQGAPSNIIIPPSSNSQVHPSSPDTSSCSSNSVANAGVPVSDLASEKSGLVNDVGFHANPGQCINASADHSVPVERANSSSVNVTINHNDMDIGIKPADLSELTSAVKAPIAVTETVGSPDVAVTISPVDGTLTKSNDEGNGVSVLLTNNDVNDVNSSSPEGETNEKISFIAKSEFVKPGASSQSPSASRPNGPLDLLNMNDSSENNEIIQVAAVAQNGPV